MHGRFLTRIAILTTTAAAAMAPQFAVSATHRPDSGYVWWQAEKPAATNFPASTWLSANTPRQKAALSGGQWLTVYGRQRKTAFFATYKLNVPHNGTWRLWVRKCGEHGPFKYRFDSQPWNFCSRHEPLIGGTTVRQWFPANWIRLARVKLNAGPHLFTMKLTAPRGRKVMAAYDCFALVAGTFIPDGKMPPGRRDMAAAPGWFAWNPQLGVANDLIDLRGLNEKQAGAAGYVRRSGGTLRLADGRPVHFWGVDVGNANVDQPHSMVRLMAKRLAAAGVDMVRYHDSLLNTTHSPAAISMHKLHALQYMVYALKKQGIYTDLSTYYAAWDTAGALGIKGLPPGAWGTDLLFVDPGVRQLDRRWMRTIFTAPDPWNHVPLGRNPAVAIVEIQNEDGLFFWNFNRKTFPAAQWHSLEHSFARWLIRRYGSLPAAYAAWKKKNHNSGNMVNPHDSIPLQRFWLYSAWHMTRQGIKTVPPLFPRMADQAEFLAQFQHRFYRRMVAYVKSKLHIHSLVSASNWTTADPDLLDGIERWTYTTGDLMDRHGYFDANHTGPNAAWDVAAGQKFISRPAVLHPRAMPFNMIQTAGFPNIMTEIGFDNPNNYRADGLILASAYGSLDGLSGLDFFAVGNDTLVDHQIKMFQVCSPAMIAQFPAAAVIFRRGLVNREAPVVREWTAIRRLQSLANARHPLIPPFNPLWNMVGPVVRHFDSHRTAYQRMAMGNFLHPAAKIVTSANHELHWNYKKGRLIIRAPGVAGVVGFMPPARAIKTPVADFAMKNRFASVLLVSLNSRPPARANRLLLQVMTRERPLGFKTHGHTIASIGAGPWNIKDIRGTVTLKGANWASAVVQALHADGVASRHPPMMTRTADSLTIRLRPHVLYYLISRRP